MSPGEVGRFDVGDVADARFAARDVISDRRFAVDGGLVETEDEMIACDGDAEVEDKGDEEDSKGSDCRGLIVLLSSAVDGLAACGGGGLVEGLLSGGVGLFGGGEGLEVSFGGSRGREEGGCGFEGAIPLPALPPLPTLPEIAVAQALPLSVATALPSLPAIPAVTDKLKDVADAETGAKLPSFAAASVSLGRPSVITSILSVWA